MQKSTLQDYLLASIKKNLPPNCSLVDVLQNLLQISQAGAYRRAKNETNFSLEEVVILCRHFNLSVDAYLDIRTENIMVQYYRFVDTDSFKHYLETILARLRLIADSPEGKVVSADDDLPILQHFRYPEHTAFKVYYWLVSMLSPAVEKPIFSPTFIDEELLQLASEIYEVYSQIPTTEIWTPDCANTTLKQIQYCEEMNLFESQDLKQTIKQQFAYILSHLESKAAMHPHYQLYLSEVQIDNNCIWAKSTQGQEVFIRHQSFNVVHTDAPNFCEDTYNFLETIIQKSTLLSGVAEIQRNHFFTTLKEKLYAI